MRWGTKTGAVAVVAAVLVVAGPRAVRAADPVTDFSRYVNPFIGTAAGAADRGTGGGAGNTFPGPVLPGGMIRMGPDTLPSSLNSSGGYAYADRQIRGFSLLRMSGAGCTNYRDVPITPTTAPITSSPVAQASPNVGAQYVSTFSHRSEQAGPGSYQVTLDERSGQPIDVQLTSTIRAAVARFRFPAARAASLLVNAAGSAGDSGNEQAGVTIDPARREISGSETSGGFCLSTDRYQLYFAIRFDRPFTAYGTWRRQSLAPGTTSSADSLPVYPGLFGTPFRAQAGGYLSFDTTTNRTVEVRVGISFVSLDGARRNLDAETGGRSFDTIRQAAGQAWNSVLGRVAVSGGRRETVERFYTALYQSLIEPGTFSDVDGRYPGMDGRVRTARGYTQYADVSGWDVYRTQLPLLAMVRPDVAGDVAQSLLADAQQSGWLPKWPVAASQTDEMTGDPAAVAIAGIYAFGVRNFQAQAALAAMEKGATQTGRSANNAYVERPGLAQYLALGYIPHEFEGNLEAGATDDLVGGADHIVATTHQGLPVPSATDLTYGSAGTTLEYAAADFAISRLSRALGDPAACRAFLARSGNWRNLFNPRTGYVEPRLATGLFMPGYNPNTNDVFATQGFAEGDAAQYTWMVPFDPAGLFAAMGGPSVATRRLDSFFTKLNEGIASPYAFMGNEPNSNAPWLYDWLGQPYKTQALVTRILGELYHDNPGGFPGNDDLGQMSAWYVMSAIGLYPAVPGTDILAVGSPQFPQITLHLPRRDVQLRAPGAGNASYINGLAVNGRPSPRAWLTFSQLTGGATVDFRMSTTPNRSWGASSANAPPSFRPHGSTGC